MTHHRPQRHEDVSVSGWDFSAMRAYAADPTCFDAERVAGQAQLRAVFAEHDARVRAEQERRWAEEGQ